VRVPRRGGSAPNWVQRNPPATVADQLRGRVVFDALARRSADQGAAAVVLGGSWARGEAHRASDIDMWVIGRRYGQRTVFRDGFVVNIENTTERIERRRFRDPRRVGGCVPGWRSAFLVYDPRGVAAKLQDEARAFRWSTIAPRCDRWVAHEVTGLAEEAIKLVRALAESQPETAAVQRNLIANHLAVVMAVHRRILGGSENGLWERVGARVGGKWRAAQRAALGVGKVDFEGSCRAALELYLLTVDAVRTTLSSEQVRIVEHVRGVVEGTALGPC
jgi:predicted nucleotidyltransferase